MSSLRLVSWVLSVVMDSGISAWRRAIRWWNSSGATENSVGSAPDLRQGAQPGVAEERGVLHTLGHDHAGGLLEAAPQFGARLQAGVEQQRQQQPDGVGQLRTAPDGQFARFLQDVRALGQVAAVDREGGDDLGQGIGGRLDRESCAGRHQPRQPEHLGVEDPVGDPALGAPDHVLVVRRPAAAQLGVEGVQGFLPGGVDEEPVHVGQGVVAGGALAVEARPAGTSPGSRIFSISR